jgi:hypothetical protein
MKAAMAERRICSEETLPEHQDDKHSDYNNPKQNY